MNDKQIEDMLRDSITTQPPDGMRDRVLRQARLELSKHKKPAIWGINRWKFVFVSIAFAIITMCNISDNVRSTRVAEMTGVSHSNRVPSPKGKTYFEMNREMKELLASLPYDNYLNNSDKGDEQL